MALGEMIKSRLRLQRMDDTKGGGPGPGLAAATSLIEGDSSASRARGQDLRFRRCG